MKTKGKLNHVKKIQWTEHEPTADGLVRPVMTVIIMALITMMLIRVMILISIARKKEIRNTSHFILNILHNMLMYNRE